MVSLLILVVGGLLLVAFVLAPLVRGEEDLKPLRRPRPGMRHLHGRDSDDEETDRGGISEEPHRGTTDVGESDPDKRQCPHCGAQVDTLFKYCGECCNPLP